MILYIHPHGHLLSDNIIPHGAFYTLNTVAHEKMGIYSWEMNEDLIRKAQVVLMDVHWPFAIETAQKIARHVKRISPETPIVLGGFIADNYPELLLEIVPADYAVFNNAEISLNPLIECLVQDTAVPDMPNVLRRGFPPGPIADSSQEEFNRLDFIDCSWFPQYFSENFRTQDGKPEFHMLLTRGCCSAARTSGANDRCNIRRASRTSGSIYRTPEQLEKDLDALEQLFPGCENYHVYLYAGAIEPWLMSEYLRVIGKPRKIIIWIFFCQTLCENLLSFLEWKEQNIGILILLTCYSWKTSGRMMALTDEEKILLNRILDHDGMTVEDLERRIASPGHEFPFVLTLEFNPDEQNKRIEIACNMPINWKIPPDAMTFDSDKDLFAYMCAFGRAVNRLLPLRLFAPGLYQSYGFSTDPQLCMPSSPGWADGRFHQSVESGMRKWGIMVPEYIDYRAIFVQCEKAGAKENAFFHAKGGDIRICGGCPMVDAEVEVDETGWLVRFCPAPGALQAFENVCAVILPAGLEAAIENQPSMEFLVMDLSSIRDGEGNQGFQFRLVNGRPVRMNG